ncbi:MAG: homoaconitase [bacterium]
MAQNVVEKITQAFSVGLPPGTEVRAGDLVRIRPRHVMTHDNTSAVIPKFRSIGAARVKDPRQPVFVLDHEIQNESPENLAKYAKIEDFARQNGIAFFPAKSGIGHQIMAEEGFVRPGSFVVGSDSHSNLYGALGAVGTPVVRTDAAAIWATGETWWEVPPVSRVRLVGKLADGVVGKDVIISLIGTFRKDEVLNHAIEFEGEGVASLTMDQRMTIANMTTEWGALVGVFPFDDVLASWLRARARRFRERGDAQPRLTDADVDALAARRVIADPGAAYALDITLDLSAVVPHVAGPNEVKTITPLPEMEKRGIRIQKAYLISCVNSRLEDLVEAARVVRGKRFAEGVKFYLAAASASVEEEARRVGAWGDLLAAGAIPLPPGCGPCIGLGTGTLEAGEVGISATNRNFKGRMGSRDAECYLASPSVVAASAVAGRIAGHRPFEGRPLVSSIRPGARAPRSAADIEILKGFPARLEGEIVWLPKDNMNTDGIYGKDVTYKDDLGPAEMAQHVFRNYDPEFVRIAHAGDLVVGGANFGSGSSREQAATAIKFFGIPLVIAATFSQTYKRNAFNNGFPLLECPDLVELLRARFGATPATIRTGWRAAIDFRTSRLALTGPGVDARELAFLPLGPVAQQLVVAGGAEAWVAQALAAGGSA